MFKTNFAFIATLLVSISSISVQASTLAYQNHKGEWIALGADRSIAHPEAIQMYRCKFLPEKATILPNTNSMGELRLTAQGTNCNPVTKRPIPYKNIPGAILQAYQDWDAFLTNPKAVRNLVNALEKKRTGNELPEWSTLPGFLSARVRFGNTEFALMLPKDEPVTLEGLRRGLDSYAETFIRSTSPGYFLEMPEKFREATDARGIGLAKNAAQFFNNVEIWEHILRFADSQTENNEECRALIARLEASRGEIEAKLLPVLEFFESAKTVKVLNKLRNATALENPRKIDETYDLTEGNLCYQKLLHANRILGEKSDDFDKVLKVSASDLHEELDATARRIQYRVERPQVQDGN